MTLACFILLQKNLVGFNPLLYNTWIYQKLGFLYIVFIEKKFKIAFFLFISYKYRF
jgi:hypothetical protein